VVVPINSSKVCLSDLLCMKYQNVTKITGFSCPFLRDVAIVLHPGERSYLITKLTVEASRSLGTALGYLL